MQPNAPQQLSDSNADAGSFSSPSHEACDISQDTMRQEHTLIAGTAQSPVSVRPKQRSAPAHTQCRPTAWDEDQTSLCSHCMDCPASSDHNCSGADGAKADTGAAANADGDNHTAQTRKQQQQGQKAAGKAGGGKRKQPAKRQGSQAPLVMSRCYAEAVGPGQQAADGQANSHSADENRHVALFACGSHSKCLMSCVDLSPMISLHAISANYSAGRRLHTYVTRQTAKLCAVCNLMLPLFRYSLGASNHSTSCDFCLPTQLSAPHRTTQAYCGTSKH